MRKVKKKATTGPKAVRKRKGVRYVAVESVALVEIGPDHLDWTDTPTLARPIAEAKGCIVKLVPPPGTPEDVVREMERGWYAGGAASVKVMPVQEDVKVTVEGEEFDFSEDADARPLREVVMDRVDRTTNSHDIDALRVLCSEAMDQGENP